MCICTHDNTCTSRSRSRSRSHIVSCAHTAAYFLFLMVWVWCECGCEYKCERKCNRSASESVSMSVCHTYLIFFNYFFPRSFSSSTGQLVRSAKKALIERIQHLQSLIDRTKKMSLARPRTPPPVSAAGKQLSMSTFWACTLQWGIKWGLYRFANHYYCHTTPFFLLQSVHRYSFKTGLICI